MMALAVWGAYCTYVPFEAWWYLRFLLPCWPAICVGVAVILVRPVEHRTAWSRRASVFVLLGLGLYGLFAAVRHDVFPVGEGERRYATIAKLVEETTEPSTVIVTGPEHAGPIRYYAGRMTLRFDLLDAEWLDRAVEWLRQRGRHPYILLEDWELPQFERRFAAKNTLGRLQLAPVLVYQAYRIPGAIYLFDPLRPDGPTRQPAPIPDPRPRCVAPAPMPPLTLEFQQGRLTGAPTVFTLTRPARSDARCGGRPTS